ncbi:hypothetical protein BDF20DRAFT_701276 [Mycotypha africana]|uniref:uncharacterized protein n=1 Tax=Mycotypha africana TaxID=64632 RepID=UPI0023015491|nr:uncharacterized protein BDF20DRAFT_701276 [Mycotypha africana]KAI8971834.1 hypothetical protein BDF20DRAFT_701276 [Mycotypha africana]
MTDSLIYHQQYNDFVTNGYSYHNDFQTDTTFIHHIEKDDDKKARQRLSFSALLQKSSFGRRISMFGRQQQFIKPSSQTPNMLIPGTTATMKQQESITAIDNSLERVCPDFGTTTSVCRTATTVTDEEDDNPRTPSTNSTISSSTVTRKSSAKSISVEDLRAFITEFPASSNCSPLKDYSGKGYSNFYMKLPNGNWMVRVRDGNRKIVGTFEVDGYMV